MRVSVDYTDNDILLLRLVMMMMINIGELIRKNNVKNLKEDKSLEETEKKTEILGVNEEVVIFKSLTIEKIRLST